MRGWQVRVLYGPQIIPFHKVEQKPPNPDNTLTIMFKKYFTGVRIDILGIILISLVALLAWDGYWFQKIGSLISVLSFILWTVSRIHLEESIEENPESERLVTDGIYSKIRQPMYIFSSMCLFGLSLALNSAIFYVIFLVLVFLQLNKMKQRELLLEERFGEEYRKYKKRTWF
jgi:protein-S-isoprenylcysteine O-methyltransferase Ste14